MTSNRPFLSNFLAAFRAHSSAFPKTSPALSTSPTTSTAQTVWSSTTQSAPYSTTTPSASRPIPDPRKINAPTNRQPSPGPGPVSPTYPSLTHNVSPLTHSARTPPPTGSPVYGPPNKPQPNYPTPQERGQHRRRGSDSSSDGGGGFRDVGAARGERWYIGGRTAGGEEKYYKLSMVRRERSEDRLSADRLSL